MTKTLFTLGLVLGLATLPATAVVAWIPAAQAQAVGDPPPPARLIRPKMNRAEPRSPEVLHRFAGPLDEHCRALKQELETALRQPARARRAFQAQLAHNAGTRLCREGHADKGMAEFRKGLSYLDR